MVCNGGKVELDKNLLLANSEQVNYYSIWTKTWHMLWRIGEYLFFTPQDIDHFLAGIGVTDLEKASYFQHIKIVPALTGFEIQPYLDRYTVYNLEDFTNERKPDEA